MRSILAVMLAAALGSAAVQNMSQDMLQGYLANGAAFDFILIDVRSSAEITEVIGNNACQPYNLEWPVQFKNECVKIPKDCAVIIYCRSGGRAAGAANHLSAQGYTKVFNAGGMLTWNGPTISPSRIKPAMRLPEFSMRAKAAAARLKPPVAVDLSAAVWAWNSEHPMASGSHAAMLRQ